MTFSIEVEPSVLTVPVTSALSLLAVLPPLSLFPHAANRLSAMSAARIKLISFFIQKAPFFFF